MFYQCLLVLAAAATGSLGATPQGFEPASETPLMVTFNGLDGSGGKLISQSVSQKQPALATMSKLTGTSYAIMMIDLSIPTNSPPQTSTLLHWMQVGLTPSQSAVTQNTTAGSMQAFPLKLSNDNSTAFAPYIAPNPPARIPLAHNYTQILVDTSSASQANLATLKSAAANRGGFVALDVLKSAGLDTKVVAGNFFIVSNPGPAVNTSGTGSTSGTGTGTTSAGSTTGNTTSTTGVPQRAAAGFVKASGLLVAAAALSAAFFSL